VAGVRRGFAMRRFLFCVTVAATLAVGLAAGTATSAGTPRGGVDRVMADVYVQVVLRPEMIFPAQRLGIAHIQVQGWDLDPTPPVTSLNNKQTWVS
jgi:hypothetical protein